MEILLEVKQKTGSPAYDCNEVLSQNLHPFTLRVVYEKNIWKLLYHKKTVGLNFRSI